MLARQIFDVMVWCVLKPEDVMSWESSPYYRIGKAPSKAEFRALQITAARQLPALNAGSADSRTKPLSTHLPLHLRV